MFSSRFVSVLLMMVFTASSYAQQPDPLEGNWTSRTASGVFTQLEIDGNGSFVLRQQHASDLRRDYLCGHLTDLGDSLLLEVGAMKERLASGDIEQLSGETTLTLDVIRRSTQQIIVTYKRRTVVLQLT